MTDTRDSPASALDPAKWIADLRRVHHHGHTSNPRRDYCTADNQDWPCAVSRLIAAIEVADAALKRHMQWFDSMGERLCGGCLRPVPCPDADVIAAALAGKDSSDEQ